MYRLLVAVPLALNALAALAQSPAPAPDWTCEALVASARAKASDPRPEASRDLASTFRQTWQFCLDSGAAARPVVEAGLLQLNLPEFNDPEKELELLDGLRKRLETAGIRDQLMIRVFEGEAGAYATMERDGEALASFQEALELRVELFGARSPEAAQGMFLIAYMHASMAKRGQKELHENQAVSLALEAVGMLREDRGDRDFETLNGLISYAGVLEQVGREKEAAELRARYGELWESAGRARNQ